MARSRRNKRNIKRTIIETISNKNFMIASSILVVLILLCLGFLHYDRTRQMAQLEKDRIMLEQKIQQIYEMEQQAIVQAEETQSKISSIIRLSAVGDILCGNDMLQDAKQEDTYNFTSMFTNMPSYVKNADVVVGTMETNFCANQALSGIKQYNSPQTFAQAVKKSGIDMVTLAHNHSYDYGEQGLLETKQYLESIGFTTIGTKQEESRLVVKEYRGAKIAFLSYTYGCAGADATSMVNVFSEENVKQDMAQARQQADFICVMMHWGEVDSNEISEEQRTMAGLLIEEGAGIIIGSHPSTIQPIEIVQNKEGNNVLVAYSLGNYISSYGGNHANVEMMLDIELLRSGETGQVYLKSVNYTPLYVLDNGKNAENRYELVDMKQLAERYVAGNTSIITKKTYDEIIEGLKWMEEIIT